MRTAAPQDGNGRRSALGQCLVRCIKHKSLKAHMLPELRGLLTNTLQQVANSQILNITHARSGAQLCPTLCDPMDCSPPVSSVYGIFQARILEWVALWVIFLNQGRTHISCVSCIGRRILYHCATWEALYSPICGTKIIKVLLKIFYYEKEYINICVCIYIYVKVNHFAVYLKLTQH